MDYKYLESLKRTHPAWRLLTADNAPFVISFLERIFIQGNVRGIRESLINEKMDDHILYLNSIYGDDAFPRKASDYLDDWSDESRGWLRKYYPRLGDEAEYDITPTVEKVIEWLHSFRKREFVGTESRLLLIFQMLKDLVNATETDPQKKIKELKKQKKEIDEEIKRVKEGNANPFDLRQIKENLWRIDEEIRHLMSDFREVEENFRKLDRQTREQIVTGSQVKGKILDEIFEGHDTIKNSEQGHSFSAFWFFLMSLDKQEELEDSVEKLLHIDGIDRGSETSSLRSMKYNLLEAGDKVKKTLGNLNEQLRVFLDEKKWLENRRIMDLIKSLEESALNIRTNPPTDKSFFSIDSMNHDVKLSMERSLFSPPQKPPVMDDTMTEGQASDIPEALYNQHYVDEYRLHENIRAILSIRSQASLKEICEAYPVEKGLAEIITYIVIASKNSDAIIDTSREQVIEYNDRERLKNINLPLILFSK